MIATGNKVLRRLLCDSYPALGNPGTVVPVDVDVDVPRHDAPVIVLFSNVTAAVCANARPFRSAPVCKVIEVEERMLPVSCVLVPRTAELT